MLAVHVYPRDKDVVHSWTRGVVFVMGKERVFAELSWSHEMGYELVFEDEGCELAQREWDEDELGAVDDATCGVS